MGIFSPNRLSFYQLDFHNYLLGNAVLSRAFCSMVLPELVSAPPFLFPTIEFVIFYDKNVYY